MLSTFALLSVNSAKHLYHEERDPSVAENRSLRVTRLRVYENFVL